MHAVCRRLIAASQIHAKAELYSTGVWFLLLLRSCSAGFVSSLLPSCIINWLLWQSDFGALEVESHFGALEVESPMPKGAV